MEGVHLVEVEDVSAFEDMYRDPPPPGSLQMGQVLVLNSELQPPPMPLRKPNVAPQSLFMPESVLSKHASREQEGGTSCSICFDEDENNTMGEYHLFCNMQNHSYHLMCLYQLISQLNASEYCP